MGHTSQENFGFYYVAAKPRLNNRIINVKDSYMEIKNKHTLVMIKIFAISLILVGGLYMLQRLQNPTVKSISETAGNIQGLPPDPGEAGKATLAGIDSDEDGIRDDIQRYISLTYSTSARTRAGLTQFVKADQSVVLTSADHQASIRSWIEVFHAQECLSTLRPNDYITLTDELDARLLNTKSRSLAYAAASGQYSGQSYAAPPRDERKVQCNFNPDILPD